MLNYFKQLIAARAERNAKKANAKKAWFNKIQNLIAEVPAPAPQNNKLDIRNLI